MFRPITAIFLTVAGVAAVAAGCAGRISDAGPPCDGRYIPSDGGFSVTVSAPARVTAGGQVRVVIRIQNTSDQPLSFRQTDESLDLQPQVWFGGQPASRTAYGNLIKPGGRLFETSGSFVALVPGQARDYIYDLSRVYDMTLSGVYCVCICRAMPKLGGPPIEKMFPSHRIASQIAKIAIDEPMGGFR